jgi:hypothetical protein
MTENRPSVGIAGTPPGVGVIDGVRVTVGVFVMVGVLVIVGVLVTVGVAVGSTMGHSWAASSIRDCVKAVS